MPAPMSNLTEEEVENLQLKDEDIVEVHEDEGEAGEPMSDDDDEDEVQGGIVPDDGEGPYDGEIVIGGPGPGEEYDEDMDMEGEGGEAARPDNSWGVSSLHAPQQSIFTISLHPLFPEVPLAISGGEDDVAFIFSPLPASNAETTAVSADTFPPVRLTGHTDSVVAARWSFDGEMVATGGMDGKVRVWRRVQRRKSQDTATAEGSAGSWEDWEFLTSLDTSSEIVWLQWHPKGNVLAAGCEDAQVWMWQLPSGNTMAVLSSHTFASTVGHFPPPLGRQLLTASLDSSLILWDPRTSSPVFKTSVFCTANSPHMDPSHHGITALAVSPNGQLAAAGGANGLVKIINLPGGNVVSTFLGHTEGESVEALVFVDVLNGAGGGKGVVLVSGGTDGKGFVWDVATGRVRAELRHDEPITSLAVHPSPSHHLVTSASADGNLKTWDVRTGALIATHQGHAGVVNGVAVAAGPTEAFEGAEKPLGQVIVSAGDEGVSLIWKL